MVLGPHARPSAFQPVLHHHDLIPETLARLHGRNSGELALHGIEYHQRVAHHASFFFAVFGLVRIAFPGSPLGSGRHGSSGTVTITRRPITRGRGGSPGRNPSPLFINAGRKRDSIEPPEFVSAPLTASLIGLGNDP